MPEPEHPGLPAEVARPPCDDAAAAAALNPVPADLEEFCAAPLGAAPECEPGSTSTASTVDTAAVTGQQPSHASASEACDSNASACLADRNDPTPSPTAAAAAAKAESLQFDPTNAPPLDPTNAPPSDPTNAHSTDPTNAQDAATAASNPPLKQLPHDTSDQTRNDETRSDETSSGQTSSDQVTSVEVNGVETLVVTHSMNNTTNGAVDAVGEGAVPEVQDALGGCQLPQLPTLLVDAAGEGALREGQDALGGCQVTQIPTLLINARVETAQSLADTLTGEGFVFRRESVAHDDWVSAVHTAGPACCVPDDASLIQPRVRRGPTP